MEALKTSENVWIPLKKFEPGTAEDLIVLGKIIFKYFKEDPVSIIVSRAGYALISVGVGPFPPWLYTPPSRKMLYDDNIALVAETLGSIKTPGDPFYSRSGEIYRDAYQMPPYEFSYGIVFIFAALFLYAFIPVTSLLSWLLVTKLLMVGLLAPVHAMHYVFDVYWMCVLIPVLAWVEYKERPRKALDLSR